MITIIDHVSQPLRTRSVRHVERAPMYSSRGNMPPGCEPIAYVEREYTPGVRANRARRERIWVVMPSGRPSGRNRTDRTRQPPDVGCMIAIIRTAFSSARVWPRVGSKLHI
eukprot:6638864-Pyramimonas_sp.AAC.2